MGGEVVLKGMSVYSSTKAYVNHFTEALEAEVRDKLDIMALTPGYVKTDLIGNPDLNLVCITAENCVKGGLNDMGHGKLRSKGYVQHDFFNSIYKFLYNYLTPVFHWDNHKRLQDL
jgi:short-subunit dehydrogenase